MEYIITTIAFWLIVHLFAPGKKRVESEGGELLLTYKPMFKWVIRACWLFPVVVAVVAMIDPPNKGEGWIVFAIIIGYSAIALPTAMELERRRIVLNDQGISQESAWSKPLSIAWKDVREVKVNANGVVVVSKRGHKVNVSLYLEGVEESLADALEEHLPTLASTPKVVARIRGMRERYMRRVGGL